MTFYLQEHGEVTSDFYAKRDTALGIHGGWDHVLPRSTPVQAPQPGPYHFQIIRQHSTREPPYKPDLTTPAGHWWPYSRYYQWWVGGLCVLFGLTHTFVFGHIDLDYIYRKWEVDKREYRQPKLRAKLPDGRYDYTSYVLPEINWQPYYAEEGQTICETGIAGYDTASHLHMQVMERGYQHKRVDPATIWPERVSVAGCT